MFKTTLGNPLEKRGARYKPAPDSGDLALADELVTWFKEREPSRITFDDRVREMSARLEAVADDFDPNTFLDCLVMQITERVNHNTISNIYNLIDPLLQTLYLEGHRKLMLDLSPFPNMTFLPPKDIYIAHSIHGEEKNKLKLQVWGDLYHIASSVSHCVIDCYGTVYGSAASHAKFSEMTFHKPAATVGANADSCVFHVRSWTCLPLTNPKGTMPKNCTYHVNQPIPKPCIETFKKKGFFDAGNTLIMRDHDNEWVKVNPDGY